MKGDLDHPQFRLREAFLTQMAIGLAETLGFPIKVADETSFEGSGKGVEGLAEGLNSVQELFKKKREKKR